MSPASVSNTPPRPRAFRIVQRYARAVCLVPFTYALLGLLALSAPNYEVFPFFSWFLFPVTPATVTRFGVQIQHPAGDSTNRWYEQDTSLGVARHSMDAQVLIQTLGSAVERKDLVSVHQMRSTFEGNFSAALVSLRAV